MEETDGAEPSTCYYSKESKQTVSTELQWPHQLDRKAACKRSLCSRSLLQLYCSKMAEHGQLHPAWLGTACLTLPAALPYFTSAWFTQRMKSPSTKATGKWTRRTLHPLQEGLLTRMVAFTGGCRDRKLPWCTGGYFLWDGNGALLNKAKLQASQHTTALAIK